ncbi:Alkaline phosphatase synthesis transcriptional regulatory protein PhoP [Phycisphaerae bacterium RAS1]|nr:Alkaline phosphatase synthesis transcriptional regulatory protein PhoP [Phycisphaerae bacterium RAS1]
MARIVIAEDQPHIRHVMSLWLRKHGHDVVEACNGAAALDALRGVPADLLITDVNMPEMDGIELTRCAFGACATLRRVFVVTSRCDQADILLQLCDPRVSVLPKPFSPSQLLREVESAAALAASAPPPGELP